MNGSTAVLLAILGLVGTGMGVYYMARSNMRETARQRQVAIDKAVSDAVAPVARERDEARQTIRERDRRIERLEDELRRAR